MIRARQAGFTLLEMLVALMVLALLVSLVYGMVRIGAHSWESGAAQIEASDAMRIGWTFLQRSLNNAKAVPSKQEDQAGVHFFGTSERLEFVADMPAYLGAGGLHALGLGLERDPQGALPQLVLQRIPLGDYESALNNPDQLQRAVLADAVTHLAMSYYGSPDPSVSPEWQAEWSGIAQLPILVKVEVELAAGSHWPILIAHPRLGIGRQEEALPDEALPEDAADTPPPAMDEEPQPVEN